MPDDAEDLYQARIFHHARQARADERLVAPTATVTVDNALCGDRVTLEVAVEGETVTAIGHKVRGCALCQAATALIKETVTGAPVSMGETALEKAQAVVDGETLPPGPWTELDMFEPVADIPSRHRCVLLPFEALDQALRQVKVNTTEG